MTKTPNIPGLNIVKKLAEGGQGEVFIVNKNGQQLALKLYNSSSATPEQRSTICFLVQEGVPAAGCANKFAWPMEFVDLPQENRFGYLMPLIDAAQYVTLSDIKTGRVEHPGYGIMAEACRQMAECFRELHIAGYCYRDISENNFLFSPKTGDVMICDNDNIMIDKHAIGNMIGTPGFMAPEVVMGTARPSTVTDQQSLAYLLFVMMCFGHPLHGEQEFKIRIFDGVAAQQIYGRNPVFVFDPKDCSNALPNEPGYRHVAQHWSILPAHLRALFEKAFTAGLMNPAQRVTEVDWLHAFTQLLSQRHVCTCGAENFWDPAQKEQTCWHRQCSVTFPVKLYVQGKTITALLVKPGQMLTSMHLGEKSSSTIMAAMENHPTEAEVCLLRNKTGDTWTAIYGKQQIDVPPGKAVPLYTGIRIKVAHHEFAVHP